MKRREVFLFVVVLTVTFVTAAQSAGVGSRAGAVPGQRSAARWVESIGSSGGVVWAIDRHNFVWLSMDSGRTWRVFLRTAHWPKRVTGKPFKVQSPRDIASLEQMQFIDKRHGWISVLLDGGPVSISPVDKRPWAIERTADGGRTWRISWLPGCGCGNGFVSFFDARHGYVLAADRLGRGKPRLFWTNDGGASWKLVGHGPDFGPITFLNRRDGVLGTYPGATGGVIPGGRGRRIPGVLYRTTDAGKTWSKERVPPPSVDFSPLPVGSFGRLLVVARGIYRHDPKVFTSVDDGTHWTAFAPRLPAKAVASDFTAGSSEMWAFVTPGRLYVTHDGGHSWSSIVPRGLPDAIYQPLVFSSPSVGWALVGRDRELYRTTDGGRHWTPVALRLRTR